MTKTGIKPELTTLGEARELFKAGLPVLVKCIFQTYELKGNKHEKGNDLPV